MLANNTHAFKRNPSNMMFAAVKQINYVKKKTFIGKERGHRDYRENILKSLNPCGKGHNYLLIKVRRYF